MDATFLHFDGLVKGGIEGGAAAFDPNEAVLDPVLRDIMVEQMIEAMFAIQVMQEDPSRMDYTHFATEVDSNPIFQSVIGTYGLTQSARVSTVPCTVATRAIQLNLLCDSLCSFDDMDGTRKAKVAVVTPCRSVVCDPFVNSATLVYPGQPTVEDFSVVDMTVKVAELSGSYPPPLKSLEDVQDLHELDSLVIDAVRSTSLTDILDVAGRAIRDRVHESRLAVYYMIPYTDSFMCHLMRYDRLGRRLQGVSATGILQDTTMRYQFIGDAVVFLEGTLSITYNIDQYIVMAKASSVQLPFKEQSRGFIELYQSLSGYLTRKISFYEPENFTESEAKTSLAMEDDYTVVYGYEIVGNRAQPLPDLVPTSLYENCFSACVTHNAINIEDVKGAISPFVESRVNRLGRVTMSETLSPRVFEALAITLYIRVREKMFDATQMLAHDEFVQNRTDFGAKVRRAAIVLSCLGAIFTLPQIVPVGLVSYGVGVVALCDAIVVANTVGFASGLERIVKMLENASGLVDFIGIGDELDDDITFSFTQEELLLDTRASPFFEDIQFNYSCSSHVIRGQRFLVANHEYVKSEVGEHFSCTGERFALESYTTGRNYVSFQLYSVRKAGMRFQLGEVWSSDEYSGEEIRGYEVRDGSYYKKFPLAKGYAFLRVPEALKKHEFYSLRKQKEFSGEVILDETVVDDPGFVITRFKTISGMRVFLNDPLAPVDQITRFLSVLLKCDVVYTTYGIVRFSEDVVPDALDLVPLGKGFWWSNDLLSPRSDSYISDSFVSAFYALSRCVARGIGTINLMVYLESYLQVYHQTCGTLGVGLVMREEKGRIKLVLTDDGVADIDYNAGIFDPVMFNYQVYDEYLSDGETLVYDGSVD